MATEDTEPAKNAPRTTGPVATDGRRGAEPRNGERRAPRGKRSLFGRLRVWTVRLAVVLLVLVVALRVALPFVLPSIVDGALASAGFTDASVGRIQLGLLAGRVEVWNLQLPSDPERRLPAARLESATLDVDLLRLVGGSLHARRVEVNGVDLHVLREEDGSWSGLVDLSGLGGGADEDAALEEVEDAPEDGADQEFGPMDLIRPPFTADAIRLQDVRLHVTDRRTDAPQRRNFVAELELRVRNFGVDEPGELALTASAPGALDLFRIDARVTPKRNGRRERLDLEITAQAEGFRAPALLDLVPSLSRAGIEAASDRTDVNLAFSGFAEAADGAAVRVEATLDEVWIACDAEEVVALDDVSVTVPRFDFSGIEGVEAMVQGLRAETFRRVDGAVVVAGLAFGNAASSPSATAAEGDEAGGDGAAPSAANAVDPAPAQPPQPDREGPADPPVLPFLIEIAGLEVREAAVAWADEAIVPKVPRTVARLSEVSVGALTLGRPTERETPIKLRGDLGDLVEQIRLDASVQQPTPGAFNGNLELRLTRLDGESVRGYLADIGAEPRSRHGNLSASARFDVDTVSQTGTRIGLQLERFELSSGGEALVLADTDVPDLLLGGEDTDVRASEVSIGALELTVRRAKDDAVLIPLLRFPAGGVRRPAVAEIPVPSAGVPQAGGPAANGAAAQDPGTAQAGEEGAGEDAGRPGDDPAREAGPVEPPAAPDATPAGLPRVAIDRITLGPWKLRIDDRKTGRMTEGTVTGAVRGLRLGDVPSEGPAEVELTVSKPGFVETVRLEGTCRGKDTLGLDLKLTVEGIEAGTVIPWLGIEGVAAGESTGPGRLAAGIELAFQPLTRGSRLDLEVADLDLRFGDADPALRIERVGIDGLRTGGAARPDLGTVALRGARAKLERLADGTVGLGGFRWRPAGPQDQAGVFSPPPSQEGAAPDAEPGDDDEDEAPAGAGGQPRRPETPGYVGGAPADPTAAAGAEGTGPRPTAADGTPASDGSSGLAGGTGAEDAAPATNADTDSFRAILPTGLQFERVALEDCSVAWTDHAARGETPFALELRLDAGLGPWRPVDDGAPSELPFDITLRADGTVDELALEGTIEQDLQARTAAFRARLEGTGVRPGTLIDAYANEGSKTRIDDGRLTGELVVALAPGAEGPPPMDGGRSVRIRFRDFAWSDTPKDAASTPWLEMADARIDIANILRDAVAVDEISIAGGYARAERMADGVLMPPLGVYLAPPEPAGDGPGDDTTPIEPAETTRSPRSRLGSRLAARRSEILDLTVRKFDLRLDEFQILDMREGTRAEPIRIRGRLFAENELVILDRDAEVPPHLKLHFDAAVAPLVDRLDLLVDVAPLDEQPRFDIVARATGIRGETVSEVFPELAASLDASEIPNGSLRFGVQGLLEARRLGPLDFDLRDGFGVEAEVDRFEFRPEPNGPLWAGLDNVLLDVERFAPNSRGGNDVVIRSFDVRTPTLRLEQRSTGLWVAGMLLKNVEPPEVPPGVDEAAADPAQAGATDAAVDGTEGAATVAAAAGPADPGAQDPGAQDPAPQDPGTGPPAAAPLEPSHDSLTVLEASVQGIDVVYSDVQHDPPTVVPLTDLDMSLENYVSRGASSVPTEPLRFEAYLQSGDVALPERLPDNGLLGNLVSGVVQAVGGSGELEIERRPLFRELALRGQIEPPDEEPLEGAAPRSPSGNVQLTLSGLELTALRGVAKDNGVTIGDGLMDLSVNVRMQEDRGAEVSTNLRFAHLSVSEPAGGPVARYLGLPAPLDTVLFVLRDNTGEQRIPLNFTVGPRGVSTGQILRSGIAALGSAITTAVASSPLRVAAPVTDFLRITGGKEDLTKFDTTVDFTVGATVLSDEDRTAILRAARKVSRDRELVLIAAHELSSADRQAIERRANPTREDCRALVRRLRRENRTLRAQRQEVVATARAAWSVGDQDAITRTTRTLRGIDAELAENERGLDRLLALLQPGAERRSTARTRDAVRELADTRLQVVRELVRERYGEATAGRVEIRRPRGRVVEEVPEDAGGRIQLQVVRRRL